MFKFCFNVKYKIFLILVLLTNINISYGLEQDTGDNSECSTCHVMWLSDFQNPDVATLIPYRGTPLEKSGRELDVASNEIMCFSCHDGYILESRFRWRDKTFNHPVGGKVPVKIKIPNIEGKETFPLNLDKRIYCGTCHSAHGVDWTQNSSAIFMRAVNESSNMCRACHADHATGTREGNHPILDRISNFPQQLIDSGSKVGPGGKMVCESCHRQHGAPDKKLLVLKNGKDSKLCLTCHRDKSNMLNSKHDLTVMKPKSKNAKDQSVESSGICSACHVPHGAKGPGLASRVVSKKYDQTVGVCLACHVKEGIAGKKTINNKHGHPLKISVKKLGIKVKGNTWTSIRKALDPNIRIAKDNNTNAVRVTQSNDTEDGTNDSTIVALPLFNKQGNREEGATLIACGTCHDPHNWVVDNDEAYTEDPKSYSGNGENSFLRIKQGSNSNLCVNCHQDKSAVKVSRHNAAVFNGKQAELMNKSGNKQELESGVCGSCHRAHNGNDTVMWARTIGPGMTTIEKLCNDCHQSTGAAEEKLTGEFSHPIGKKLGSELKLSKMLRFDRNGRRVKTGGIIDCSTCHDPHQWDPQNINNIDSVMDLKSEGDTNNSFLRLRADKEAGLCLKCHKKQGYVAGTDHDMAITAPKSTNSLGQTVQQSGVCGSCHVVHNSRSATSLWGRDLGRGNDHAEKACFSCHAKDGIAGDKNIPNDLTSHPSDIKVWSGAIRKAAGISNSKAMPVFDEQGQRAVIGRITCPSCHNPHQWTPNKPSKGPGKNVEGDSSSSFLIFKTSASNVCSDCHGLDALFRYKYFHSNSARKDHQLFTK